MQKKLYLLVGLPGSGKTTWAKKRIKENSNAFYVSRDEIRFSLLKENEDYFSKEEQVFKLFIQTIQQAMDKNLNYDEIYIDATHLNERSRSKVLNRLNTTEWEINFVNFITPIEICIERNSYRTGRSLVPIDSIKKMNKWRDKIKISPNYNVIIINENGEEVATL